MCVRLVVLRRGARGGTKTDRTRGCFAEVGSLPYSLSLSCYCFWVVRKKPVVAMFACLPLCFHFCCSTNICGVEESEGQQNRRHRKSVKVKRRDMFAQRERERERKRQQIGARTDCKSWFLGGRGGGGFWAFIRRTYTTKAIMLYEKGTAMHFVVHIRVLRFCLYVGRTSTESSNGSISSSSSSFSSLSSSLSFPGPSSWERVSHQAPQINKSDGIGSTPTESRGLRRKLAGRRSHTRCEHGKCITFVRKKPETGHVTGIRRGDP